MKERHYDQSFACVSVILNSMTKLNESGYPLEAELLGEHRGYKIYLYENNVRASKSEGFNLEVNLFLMMQRKIDEQLK